VDCTVAWKGDTLQFTAVTSRLQNNRHVYKAGVTSTNTRHV